MGDNPQADAERELAAAVRTAALRHLEDLALAAEVGTLDVHQVFPEMDAAVVYDGLSDNAKHSFSIDEVHDALTRELRNLAQR
jgi:hypothetical protein